MPAFRPQLFVGILGTHTEVGKTFVTSQWLKYLRQLEVSVAARKPVQSFDPGDATTDAAQLAAATGEPITDVCRSDRCYPLALAPPMAADRLGHPPILLSELIDEMTWPQPVDVGVVETVGGPLSPLSHDGDSIDLLRRLQVDRIVLVADAGLGTLNAVRLCLQCTAPIAVTVYLNGFDRTNLLHVDNRKWLRRYDIATAIDLDELTRATLPARN